MPRDCGECGGRAASAWPRGAGHQAKGCGQDSRGGDHEGVFDLLPPAPSSDIRLYPRRTHRHPTRNLSPESGGAAQCVFGHGHFWGFSRVGALVEGVLQVGVEAVRLGELVFEDDDAASRVEGVAGIDELAHARGDTQLVARVAAVPARANVAGSTVGRRPGRAETLG